MKKQRPRLQSIIIALTLVLAMMMPSTSIFAQNPGIINLRPDHPQVQVDGENQDINPAPYITPEGRTMVPLRFIAETLGGTVEWNEENRTVTYQQEDTEILITPGSRQIIVNDEETTLDTAVVIHSESNRTMIPLRFFSETLGCQVSWNNTTRLITLRCPQEEVEEPEEPQEPTEPAEPEEPQEPTEPAEPEEPEEPEEPSEDEEELADPSTLSRLELSGDERISLPNGSSITREYTITGYNDDGEEVDLSEVPLEWNFMSVIGFNEVWNPEDAGVTLTQSGTLTLGDVHPDIRSTTWIYLLVTTPENYEHGYFEADLVITLL